MDAGSTGANRDGEAGKAAGPDAASLLGVTLGNYRVSGLLGQGGMGCVYLAEHVLIGRKVAIKVLDPQIADQADAISRFFIEARAVNEIRHPNIVEVTDLGTHAGRPFIVMEFLGGETLERRLGRKLRLPVEETVHIARQIASALGAAHDRGMVHRDLKPANVMLLDHPDYPDFVKVLDFGIAKLLGSTPPGKHRTEVGALLGTPAFMSPEQCLGDLQLDHRSDVYSMGVMLFLMLTGRLPFEGEAVGRLIMAHVNQPAPTVTMIDPKIPAAVSAVVERALAKKPGDRFADMRELRKALDSAVGRPRSLTPVLEVIANPALAPTVMPAKPAGKPAAGAGGTQSLARAAAAVRPARSAPPPGPLTPRPSAGAPQPRTPTPAALLAMGEAPEVLRQKLFEGIAARVQGGALAYPALPEVIGQCVEMLRDPSYSFPLVASLIRRDGRLASHLVRRANSDGASGKGVSATPEQAMGRLGAGWLRACIFELPARKVIDVREPRFEDIFRRPWHHALAAAIAADRLARVVGMEARAADAYLTALVRDAGVSLLALAITEVERELAGRRPPRATPIESVVEVVALHQRAVSAELARRWSLPDELCAAIADGRRFDGDGGWTITNLVKVAGALADREGFYLRREQLDDAQATIDAATGRLGLNELRVRRVSDRLKEAVRLRE